MGVDVSCAGFRSALDSRKERRGRGGGQGGQIKGIEKILGRANKFLSFAPIFFLNIFLVMPLGGKISGEIIFSKL